MKDQPDSGDRNSIDSMTQRRPGPQVRIVNLNEAEAALRQGKVVDREAARQAVLAAKTRSIESNVAAVDETVEVSEQPTLQLFGGGWHRSEASLEDLRVASGLSESSNSKNSEGESAEDDIPKRSASGFRASQLEDEVEGSDDGASSSQSAGVSAQEDSATRRHLDDARERLTTLRKASLKTRVATGVAFVVLAGAAFAAGPVGALVLASSVIVLAALEFFDALRRSGHRPATFLAILAVAGMLVGSYNRGEPAMALILVLTLFFSFLWYLTGVIRGNPTINVATTLLGLAWTGLLGSYAALMLRMPHDRGLAFLAAGIACTVAYDTCAYIGGNLFGRRPMLPSVSPNKTWEGLMAGTFGCLVMGAIFGALVSPWTAATGALLGLVVSFAAPLGDLAESMVKRDLGIKDMGSVLPGHGGLFDRFDALLFVLPSTYYLVRVLNLG